MLQFKKYNSIENTFDKTFIEKIFDEGFDNQEFVVQEKVHGSNFSFITDGVNVNVGKRTALIEANEKFYDYEELLEQYKPKVITLFSAVKESIPTTETITIFGEMFGGKYPHPDVKNNNKLTLIQKGVYYCPQHEFYAFDLYITTNETGKYLPIDEANGFFEKFGFFYAKTLFRGSLKDCLQYPNEFQSVIAEWLGLPPIEGNVCEGVIIRPVVTAYLHNGARVVLKNKNAKFAEKKSVKKRAPKLFVKPTYSEELNALLLIADEYITENRLANVVSHIGEFSIKDFGKLIGMFSKDILEDFLKEHSGRYAGIEKSEQKILNSHVSTLATNMIKRTYFS